MGKVKCGSCKKSCKGQAVRLQDKYFCVKCFKCAECKKQLAAGGFYAKEDVYYCSECYQRLYGTKCAAGCGKYVEGEVVTALGNTYCLQCFHCTGCNQKFSAGDKVTFNGKDYLCRLCLADPNRKVTSPKKGMKNGVGTSQIDGHHPITSTPARPELTVVDGYLSSPMSDTDFSDTEKGRLSPIQQIDSQRSWNKSPDMVFGKFYNSSYLKEQEEKKKKFKKGPSINLSELKMKSPDFHRPENFSYNKNQKDFLRPVKRDASSMMALGDQKYIVNRKITESVNDAPPLGKDEMKYLAKFPTGEKPEALYRAPIERDDWPSPPNAAAAYPELLYDVSVRRPASSRHTSGGDMVDGDSVEKPSSTAAWDDDEEEAPVNPKVQKEIDQLKQIKSGVGAIMLKELEKKKHISPVIDPRSASRTPSAKHEPQYKTRYESPVFASPSRDNEYRPRLHSFDDELADKKYRNSTLPISNFPVPRPGYGLKSATLQPGQRSMPTYDGYQSDGGIIHEVRRREHGYESDGGLVHEMRRREPVRISSRGASSELIDKRSHYTSDSSMDEYDPETGLRRSRFRYSTASSNFKPSYMSFRSSMPSMANPDEPPKIYPFEQLMITNFKLPPDVDRNYLEQNLSKEEFESIFHMTQKEFYRLAEWKRNDLKKRVGLY